MKLEDVFINLTGVFNVTIDNSKFYSDGVLRDCENSSDKNCKCYEVNVKRPDLGETKYETQILKATQDDVGIIIHYRSYKARLKAIHIDRLQLEYPLNGGQKHYIHASSVNPPFDDDLS